MFDNETWLWINQNLDKDPAKLRLSKSSKGEFAITQIECRHKAKSKLAHTLEQIPAFVFPSTISAEQCTSDALAMFHSSLIDPGDKVLDMTCGLGIDALHLSRRASALTAIEIDPTKAEVAAHNYQGCNIDVVCADSSEWVTATSDRFDTIFIDPSRRGAHSQRLYAIEECQPNVIALMPTLLRLAPKVIIKLSPMVDISAAIRSLPGITQIYAVGTPTECKEIVAVVGRDAPTEVEILAATMVGDDTHIFRMTATDEEQAIPIIATIDNLNSATYLYEPFPALLKIGAYKTLADRYKIQKLSKNSHLYISSDLADDFPGRIHQITDVIPYHNSSLKGFNKKYPTINVTSRNFPLQAPALAKRLKIKEGGLMRLFATKVGIEEANLLIITH